MKAEEFRMLRENVRRNREDTVTNRRTVYSNSNSFGFVRVYEGDVVELEGSPYDQFQGWTKRTGVVIGFGQDESDGDTNSYVRLSGADGLPIKATHDIYMGGVKIKKNGRRAKQEAYRLVQQDADRRRITFAEFLVKYPEMAQFHAKSIRRTI